MQWKFILSLIIMLLFVAFVGQNWQIVNLHVFNQMYPVALPFLIISSILFGFILGVIVSGIKQLKIKKELKILNEKIEKQKQELKSLRYFQIKDEE